MNEDKNIQTETIRFDNKTIPSFYEDTVDITIESIPEAPTLITTTTTL